MVAAGVGDGGGGFGSEEGRGLKRSFGLDLIRGMIRWLTSGSGGAMTMASPNERLRNNGGPSRSSGLLGEGDELWLHVSCSIVGSTPVAVNRGWSVTCSTLSLECRRGEWQRCVGSLLRVLTKKEEEAGVLRVEIREEENPIHRVL